MTQAKVEVRGELLGALVAFMASPRYGGGCVDDTHHDGTMAALEAEMHKAGLTGAFEAELTRMASDGPNSSPGKASP